MRIIMCPTTDIGSLCDALNQRYHWKMDDYDLCQLLFGDEYSNNSYISYYFEDDDIYAGYPWQDEHFIDVENKVKRYLREQLPNERCILIDVSW